MTFFLGIDGGGTGCRAAVADMSGMVLGVAESGPANITSDPDRAVTSILSASRDALVAALGESAATTEFPRLTAGLGLAGANAKGTVARLRAALPFRRVKVDTDAVAAVKGALGADDGIVAAIGTGSVFAAQRGGGIRQIGGRGLVLGDEGSAAWIGRAILSSAVRAADGFIEVSPLLATLLQEFDGPEGIVAFAQTAKPADFGALAPRVLSAADDPCARRLVDAAGAEVAAAIDLLQAEVQAEAPLPVVFLGGLGGHYRRSLAGRWTMAAPRGTALDGALMLAREAT